MAGAPKYVQSPIPQFNVNELPEANKNPDIPKLYLNGFTMGLTNADVIILGKQNNEPKVVVNLSLTLAKTLVKQLNGLIVGLEASSERDIMTTEIMDLALIKLRNEK